MSKVIIFSRQFPAYHPKAGQPTYFVEKFLQSFVYAPDNPHVLAELLGYESADIFLDKLYRFNPKHHTIRAGYRFKAGDYFSPRVWSGKPYRSKQIVIAPDTKILKVWNIAIEWDFLLESYHWNVFEVGKTDIATIAKNDGLSEEDFESWFPEKEEFDGQIICWNENINY